MHRFAYIEDLNMGHCVELTLFECKLDGFLVIRVYKFSYEPKTMLILTESLFTFTFKMQLVHKTPF